MDTTNWSFFSSARHECRGLRPSSASFHDTYSFLKDATRRLLAGGHFFKTSAFHRWSTSISCSRLHVARADMSALTRQWARMSCDRSAESQTMAKASVQLPQLSLSPSLELRRACLASVAALEGMMQVAQMKKVAGSSAPFRQGRTQNYTKKPQRQRRLVLL